MRFFRAIPGPAARVFLLAFLPLLAVAADAVRVIDETAIPLTRVLSKADFDRRHPGRTVADPSHLEPGWYVVYRHESLNYHFGPILIEATGRDYRDDLESIVKEAVAERPDLQDYTIELQRLPAASAGAGPGSSGTGAAQPNKGGFWSFVRKVFGLG